MPFAVHSGGPADGRRVQVDTLGQTRFWAPQRERAAAGWVDLYRYVFVPPRIKATCNYRYTGIHQERGPVPGSTEDEPDWS